MHKHQFLYQESTLLGRQLYPSIGYYSKLNSETQGSPFVTIWFS